MRFLVLIICTGFLHCLPAFAQQSNSDRIAFDVTAAAETHVNSPQDGGFVGLRWSSDQVFAAVEAEYASALSISDHRVAEGPSSGSLSIRAGVSVQGNWSVYGRFGFQKDSMPVAAGGEDSAMGLRIGFGTDYQLSNGLSARGELGHRILNGDGALQTNQSELRFSLIQSF